MTIPLILLGIVAVFLTLVVFVALRPSEFKVSRSIRIDAPPQLAFEQVNDLRRWEAWSPWAKLDPDAEWTYEGPPAGAGATVEWSGNRNIGKGRMTIVESHPSELVKFRLDFLKPFDSTCFAQFTFKLEGDQTVVTWSMEGKNNFVAKAMGLFMNCEKMVGGQFEKGLAQLKSLAEEAARKSTVLSHADI